MINFAFEISSDKQLRYFVFNKKTFFTTVHWQFLDIWTINDFWIFFAVKVIYRTHLFFRFFSPLLEPYVHLAMKEKDIFVEGNSLQQKCWGWWNQPSHPFPKQFQSNSQHLNEMEKEGGGVFFRCVGVPKVRLNSPLESGCSCVLHHFWANLINFKNL